MRWLTRHPLLVYVRRSAWLVPAAAIPAALAVSPVIRRIDELTQWRVLGYTPDAARSLLNAITPATLTFIVLILSTLLLTIQLASSQLSPRLIGGLLSRRPVRVCLAIFVFSYVYCAAVLGRVDDRVPQLSIAVAIGATLISVAAALYLIDYMAKELAAGEDAHADRGDGAQGHRAGVPALYAGGGEPRRIRPAPHPPRAA